MIKIIIILSLFTASISLSAQGFMGIGIGYGITSKSLCGQFEVGYLFGDDSPKDNGDERVNYNRFLLSAGYHANARQSQPHTFYGKVGRELQLTKKTSLLPSLGYGYQQETEERRSLNQWVMIGGMEICRYGNWGECWFVNYTQAGRYSFVTVGIRGIIR